MRVEIQQSSSYFISLVLFDSSQQFSSLIRRYLTKKVKTIQILGIPNSPLNTFDHLEHNLDYSTDVIQSQIQNIALNFSPKQILNFQKEDFVFKIDVFNDSVHNLMITTKDIQIFDKDNKRYSVDFIRSIFPPKPDFIHLFILQPQQLLKFTAHATKSDSSTHATFNHLSKIIVTPCVNHDIASKRLDQSLSQHSQSDQKLVTTDFNTTERFRCYTANQFNQPFNFDLSFHTISSLSPTFALYSASSQAITDIKDLINNIQIKSLTPENQQNNINIQTNFSFLIHHEISIGLLLQYTMVLDLFRVFNKNDFTQSKSFSSVHSNPSTMNGNPKDQFQDSSSSRSNNSKKKSNSSILDPSKHFCLEFVSFNLDNNIFSFSYNSHSDLDIDLVSSQIKFYLSRIMIQLNQFQSHFTQFA